jgi:protein ImuA
MGLPYGPGLRDLGLNPDSMTLLMLPDAKAVLRAALDSVRAGVAGAVLIELAGRQLLLDLTATRRFALAAAETGTMVLLGRIRADPSPSAAHSRWQVTAAPSIAFEANAPGRAAFDLSLLRHRGGRDGLHLIVEWDGDTGSFRQRREHADAAPLPRARPAVVGGGAGDTQRNHAA